MYGHPNLDPKELFETARRSALKALEHDPELAEAYATLGDVSAIRDSSVPEAERNYRRAIDLSPNNATAHLWYGKELSYWGRHEEALREIETASELDPSSMIIQASFGRIHRNARQYDKAIEVGLQALDMEPSYPVVRYFLGLAYDAKGMHEEAARESSKPYRPWGGSSTWEIWDTPTHAQGRGPRQ